MTTKSSINVKALCLSIMMRLFSAHILLLSNEICKTGPGCFSYCVVRDAYCDFSKRCVKRGVRQAGQQMNFRGLNIFGEGYVRRYQVSNSVWRKYA